MFIKKNSSMVSQSTGLDLAAGKPIEMYSVRYIILSQFPLVCYIRQRRSKID